MGSEEVKINRRGVLALGASAIALAGCASSGPAALYGLSAAETVPTGRRRGAQILVPAPRALKALDTQNIAVVDAGPVYTYFPDAAWADALPNVVQQKIVETLQNTNLLRGVGMPGDGLLIDYQLQTELRAFELNVDGQDRGVVEIAAKLVNDRNGRAVSNRVFKAVTAASSSSVGNAVLAINASADRVFSEMAEWVVQRV